MAIQLTRYFRVLGDPTRLRLLEALLEGEQLIKQGRYEEAVYHATGSGGQDARTTIKLGWKDNMDTTAAIELAVQALYEAAEEDAATGGPDLVRGIYPTIATITSRGFERVEEREIADRFRALVDRLSTPESATMSGTTPTMEKGEPTP